MDTTFAKIVSDPDGRDHLLIEGQVISLRVSDPTTNNALVDAIARGLRAANREESCSAQSSLS